MPKGFFRSLLEDTGDDRNEYLRIDVAPGGIPVCIMRNAGVTVKVEAFS